MKKIFKYLMIPSAALLLVVGGCKKDYLDRNPTDQVTEDLVFGTTRGLTAAVNGIHSLMYNVSDHDAFGQKSIDIVNDLMGEDMPMGSKSGSGIGAGWFISASRYTKAMSGDSYIWGFYYKILINANQILDHADDAVGSEVERNMAKGQAYFYRAFAYYNLSIYYQHTYAADSNLPGVPIYRYTTTDPSPRASLGELYREIEWNLRQAAAHLNPENGALARSNKSQINIDVVRGLHARVALVMHNWELADSMAAAARQNYAYMNATQLLQGFNDWSASSWMWGSFLNEEQTGIYASFLSHFVVSLNGYAALGSQKLINVNLLGVLPYEEEGEHGYDLRIKWWLSRPDPNTQYFRNSQMKFTEKSAGSFSSDLVYMRAEEMALIQAEARAHMGHLVAAKDILNELIRIRNPKYDAFASANRYEYNFDKNAISDQDKLLEEIWVQRRIELWGEGFRLSDIKRCAAFNTARTVKNGMKGQLTYAGLDRGGSGGDAQVFGSIRVIEDPFDYRFNFFIPGSELNSNKFIEQNPSE